MPKGHTMALVGAYSAAYTLSLRAGSFFRNASPHRISSPWTWFFLPRWCSSRSRGMSASWKHSTRAPLRR